MLWHIDLLFLCWSPDVFFHVPGTHQNARTCSPGSTCIPVHTCIRRIMQCAQNNKTTLSMFLKVKKQIYFKIDHVSCCLSFHPDSSFLKRKPLYLFFRSVIAMDIENEQMFRRLRTPMYNVLAPGGNSMWLLANTIVSPPLLLDNQVESTSVGWVFVADINRSGSPSVGLTETWILW